MCLVVFIASHSPLPLIPWQEGAPSFNVAELSETEECVRKHFSLPHARCAGSHTCCGCGFNEGREPSEMMNDPQKQADALESASRLAAYVREHRVEQIYSCWSGDERKPKEFERQITPNNLTAKDFFFREKELLKIVHNTGPNDKH